MIKNMGIKTASKNKQNKNKSKTVNVKTKNNSIRTIFKNNKRTADIFQAANTQNGNNKVVSITKKIEITSTVKIAVIFNFCKYGKYNE
jgi:hypothetical protein